MGVEEKTTNIDGKPSFQRFENDVAMATESIVDMGHELNTMDEDTKRFPNKQTHLKTDIHTTDYIKISERVKKKLANYQYLDQTTEKRTEHVMKPSLE